jgi:fumarylpyruvate hydrolase
MALIFFIFDVSVISLYHRAGGGIWKYCTLLVSINDQVRPMSFVFPPPQNASLPVAGSDSKFPVRRIFCVGRNYADHAREMGAMAQADGREPPFFFMKPGDALVCGADELAVEYPPLTQNLHHEVELVVALGQGGANVAASEALALIYGYTIGLDLTRRDIQGKAKEKGHPWDMGKGFDQSAVAGVIQPVSVTGHPAVGRIWLSVNGEIRQDGDLSAMMWKVADVIANLSTSVRLAAGDLIYTGTPAGVGPLQRGDRVEAGVDGVARLALRIV